MKSLIDWLAILTAQGKPAASALDRVQRLHAETGDPFDVILARCRAVAGVALPAAVGCASSAAGGGRCGSGALSAGLGELTTSYTNTLNTNPLIKGAIVGLGGGTGATLTGGSFGEGFFIAASGYLFNECAHGGCGISISLGFTDTPIGFGTNYTVAIATDTYLGKEFATRAGPGFSKDLSDCAGGLTICAQSGKFNSGFTDAPSSG